MSEIKKDKNLAKLVSYLTFDGHLAKDLKCFYLSSKNKETLKKFENIVYSKFKIKGRLEENSGYGGSHKYRVFKSDICRFLEDVGVPKGNKVLRRFLVPKWIKNDNDLSKEYLKVAFDCEGSIWTEKDGYIRIRFGVCKSEELLDDCFKFIEDLRNMLYRLNIQTTKSWITKGSLRKDGIITKGIYFKIKKDSLEDYAKIIGFSERFKKQRLIPSLGAHT